MLETLKNKWQTIKEKVRDDYNITQISYLTWIDQLDVHEIVNNNLLRIVFLGEQTDFAFDYLKNKYTRIFEAVIEEMTGFRLSVEFIPEQKNKENRIYEERPSTFSSYQISNINRKYTFDKFIVGANNKMAHAASISVAEKPGGQMNPLFLYSGPGLGKTHLMHAIANFILSNNPKAKVIYATSEAFMNEIIDALRNKNRNQMVYFREKYRNVDVLLIDDIQFIIGRAETTLEEFFNTFNYLYESGKQIVLSSDKPPREFNNLEERLKSRFERGLITEITLPDYETRMAILREKSVSEGYNIDNEILQYIATNIKSNIRVLEGALTKIAAYSNLNPGVPVTIEIAKENLKDLVDPENEKKLTPDNIISVVAAYYGIRPDDIKSKKRTKEIATPRHVAMYFIRVMTDHTLEDVGKILGDRDHTTISYGFEKITNEMKENEDFKKTLEVIRKKILQ